MKINVNGQIVEAQSVGFVAIAGEPFVEYHLENGDVVRVKLVVRRFFATGLRNENTNEPIYQAQFDLVVVVDEKPTKPSGMN